MSNQKSRRVKKKRQKKGDLQVKRSEDKGPKQRKQTEYPPGQRPKPDKHGGTGAGRQQGGSGVSREHD